MCVPHRSIAAIIVLLAATAGRAPAQGDGRAAVDPRIAGTWESAVGADRWVLEFRATGAYAFTIESATTQPGHSGTFTAAGGKWGLKSTAGTPWTDGGTYAFVDQDTLALTGNLGTAHWKRRRPGGAAPAPASAAKVAPYVAEALAMARQWQNDAVIVGVFAKTGHDGKITLERLLGPMSPYGCYLAIHAHSPAAGLTTTYGLERNGRIVVQSPPMPAGTSVTAIPASFVDLDEALAKAGEQGYKPPPADQKSFVDAKLVGVKGEFGRPDGAIWTITAVDMSGPHPAPGAQATIDAATGGQTTEATLSGRRDRERLVEELRRGQIHPAAERDWAVYRKEADGLAARWNQGLRFCAVELSGTPAAGTFAMDRATILYVNAPAAGGPASTLTVGMFPTPEGNLLRVEELDHQVDPPDVPAPAPEAILTPGEAAKRLLEMDPRVPAAPMVLTLVSGDALARAIVTEASRKGRELAPAHAALVQAMKGRFLWFARFSRITRRTAAALLTHGALDLDDVAVDAITGAPFLRRGAAASSGPRGPRRVDPALVGAWRASIRGTAIVMEFSAGGDLRVAAVVAGRSNEHKVLVDAADGRWEIETPDGEVFTGTYRMLDRDRLEWTDPKDGPATLTRTAPLPKAPDGGQAPPAPPPLPPPPQPVDPRLPKPVAADAEIDVPRKVRSWAGQVFRPADANLGPRLADQILKAIEEGTNAKVLVASESSRTGKAIYGLTFGGDFFAFDLTPAQAKAAGVPRNGATSSMRKPTAEANVRRKPRLVTIENLRFDGGISFTGAAAIKGSFSCKLEQPMPANQALYLHVLRKTYKFDNLMMRQLGATLPADGIIRFEIEPVNGPDAEPHYGPLPVLAQIIVSDDQHGAGVIASNTATALLDITGDPDSITRLAIQLFEELATSLSKVTDEASAEKRRSDWRELQSRCDAVSEAMERLRPTPEESKALETRYQSKMEAAIQRVQAEVERLEKTPWGAGFLKSAEGR
jgi:hypothetical protein